MSFGSGAMTNSIREIKDCEVLFLIGCNPTEAHPVIALEMKKALKRGATFIVADPRKIWFAKHAKVYLQHKPGTDILLISAMMNVILSEGLEDKEFIKNRTEGFEEVRELVKDITPEKVAAEVGVNAADIREAARIYASQSEKTAIFYTLGITEHTCGTDNVRTLANLAMLTGHIGKPSTGVNPLRGQNNVQGACDMGTSCDKLPGYQSAYDPVIKEKFGKAWGVKLTETKGFSLPEMIDEADEGGLKAMYIMGQDPVMSEPDQHAVKRALGKLDLLIVQDIFLCETAKLAHVVLPGASFAEKDGTFTNSERRVQRVRKAIEPIGNCKPDWEIICEIAKRMDYPMNYASPKEILDEVASLSAHYAGINFERIEHMGIQWPCPDTSHPGTQFLHKGKFTRGLGKFFALPHRAPAEQTDEEYPLILSSGRTLYHYNVGTMTRRSESIAQKTNDCFVEINNIDAGRRGIINGEMVKIITRRGEVDARAEVSSKAKEGVIWMPMHFAEASVNKLTIAAFDNITQTAEYKVCSARLEKLAG